MSHGAARCPRTLALLSCAALALLGSAPARAAIASCNVSAVGVAFGTYTPLQAAPLDVSGTINIACAGVTGRNTVTIDLSTGASNSYVNRTMSTGTATLSYNLLLRRRSQPGLGQRHGRERRGQHRHPPPRAERVATGIWFRGGGPGSGAGQLRRHHHGDRELLSGGPNLRA